MKTFAGQSWGPTSHVLLKRMVLLTAVVAISAMGCETSDKPGGDDTEENSGRAPQKGGDGVESIIRGGQRGQNDAGSLLDGGSMPDDEQPGESTDSSPTTHDDAGSTPPDTQEPDSGTPEVINP